MKINSCIIGFGSIAAKNVLDPVMSKNYRYCTHLQAIFKQRNLDLKLIFETSAKSRLAAKKMIKNIKVFEKIEKAMDIVKTIELLIITTPPDKRVEFIKKFPNIKSLIVEKPLGLNYLESEKFYKEIKKRNIKCTVNYWRRYVTQFKNLKNGYLKKILGNIQSVIAIYGNGIRNNGIHLIDFLRFLFGEISSVNFNYGYRSKESPIKNDLNIDFSGFFKSGIPFKFIPLDFNYYRDNGIKIIGEKGILSILNDCRVMFLNKTRKNKGISNFKEVNFSKNYFMKTDYDLALLNLYKEIKMKDNSSSIENAIVNEKIVQTLFERQ